MVHGINTLKTQNAIPWTAAHLAPPSMGFSRQEYWSGMPLPSPGDLPNPAIKTGSPALEADILTSEPPGKPPKKRLGRFQFTTYRLSTY